MSTPTVPEHYAHGGLVGAIEGGLAKLGKSPAEATIDDLGPLDEFHIGGRAASEAFLGQLGFDPDSHVLDVGCGLGGTARFTATRYGARVTGIDLTEDYVESGRTLCAWVGVDDRVDLHTGSALSMPFDDGKFDGAYMMHVGMNIEDKPALVAETARVLRPGATFGIYDVMRTGDGELALPVPWASAASLSFVTPPAAYRDAFASAGLEVVAERDRRDFALDFFETMRARTTAAGGPPPLGLHILMGPSAPEKIANMIANISSGSIAPVEMIGRKPG